MNSSKRDDVFPNYSINMEPINLKHIEYRLSLDSFVRIKREDKWYLIKVYNDFLFIPPVDTKLDLNNTLITTTNLINDCIKQFINNCMNVYHLYIIDFKAINPRDGLHLFVEDEDQRDTEDILKEKYKTN